MPPARCGRRARSWRPHDSAARSPRHVVVIVNGEPITALDIEQRSKLIQLSTHKAPARQEVIDELIDEKLKIKEGKRWGIEVTDSEVDSAFADMAQPDADDADQLTQMLAKSGVNAGTLKARIRADMVWQQLVRGRYQSSLQVGEKDILSCRDANKADAKRTSAALRLHAAADPVPGAAGLAPRPSIEGAQGEAEALRGRFKSCDEGLRVARALRDVAVRDQVIRSSADLAGELRKVLDARAGRPADARRRSPSSASRCSRSAPRSESKADTPSKKQAREAAVQPSASSSSRSGICSEAAARRADRIPSRRDRCRGRWR